MKILFQNLYLFWAPGKHYSKVVGALYSLDCSTNRYGKIISGFHNDQFFSKYEKMFWCHQNCILANQPNAVVKALIFHLFPFFFKLFFKMLCTFRTLKT